MLAITFPEGVRCRVGGSPEAEIPSRGTISGRIALLGLVEGVLSRFLDVLYGRLEVLLPLALPEASGLLDGVLFLLLEWEWEGCSLSRPRERTPAEELEKRDDVEYTEDGRSLRIVVAAGSAPKARS